MTGLEIALVAVLLVENLLVLVLGGLNHQIDTP